VPHRDGAGHRLDNTLRFCRYERHVMYWKMLAHGEIGTVTILHKRMHQIDRFREHFAR